MWQYIKGAVAAEREFHPAAGVLAVKSDTKSMTGIAGIRKANSITTAANGVDRGQRHWKQIRTMMSISL